MFYPVHVDLSDKTRVQQATVVLNPAASKRLLGKAVAALPEVQKAYANGRLSVSGGSTSVFVLEELTGERVEAYRYCAGMVVDGVLSSSQVEDRVPTAFFVRGEKVVMETQSFFDTFEKGDVVIKGANAVDPQGNVGVLAANNQGGTVGSILSFLAVRGIPLIAPVGLEKSIASVAEAVNGWGQLTLSKSMGLTVWLYPVTSALVVTEIQALGILAGVKARHIAGGGIAGSEGAVVLLLEGYEDNLNKAWDIVQSVKDEPQIKVPRHKLS